MLQDVVTEQSFDEGRSFKQKGINLALDDSLYIVRAYTKSSSFVLMGSCRALHIFASDGQMTLVLNVDASGSPIALSVVAKNQTSGVDFHRPTSPMVLSTMVSLQKPSFSVGPDTQEYLARVDRRREEKLRQDQADNRSFLSKYWMYILPVVFFFILLNSADQNTGGNSE
ncbi:ER membrane protein complex subunit 10 [Taenia crassiceps]|uniref:ER membrane protein complex subunit 10 n=1 Tax=Taenia crassiceps TaxID=6207 RepID=A0ABR4QL83_9CEST